MDLQEIERLLRAARDGSLDVKDAARQINDLHYEDVGYARVDHARAARQGFPEVVFGAGKRREQVVGIVERLARRAPNVLVTRTDEATYGEVRNVVTDAEWHESARLIRIRRDLTERGVGPVAVVTAGTSDIPVAEEAALTIEAMGNRVERVWDAGVAGIHRILAERTLLRRARVVVVAAGMEGALPSVVGGIVSVPVVAIPTSIGYGASFGGVAALLGMLNSCASNVTVVNIDNGFGAGFVASLINRKWEPPSEEETRRHGDAETREKRRRADAGTRRHGDRSFMKNTFGFASRRVSASPRPRVFFFLLVSFSLAVAPFIAGCGAHRKPNMERIFAVAREQKGKRPIIIIPGILGSELVNSETGERVWPSLFRSSDDGLTLPISPDLKANRDKLVPKKIVTSLRFSRLIPEVYIYHNLLEALRKYGGYSEGDWDNPAEGGDRDTFYVFAYDWRRDNVESAQLLVRRIADLKRKLGRPDLRFNIVAHSMGGLVARYAARYGDADLLPEGSAYTPNWAGAEHISKIFMFGTPNEGSADAFATLLEGYSLTEGLRRRVRLLNTLSREDAITAPALFQLFRTARRRVFWTRTCGPSR